MRRYHITTRDPESPGTAVSLCRQFRIEIPHRWDSWHGKELCANCERIRRARGWGVIGMTSMPTQWVTVQTGGHTFAGDLVW